MCCRLPEGFLRNRGSEALVGLPHPTLGSGGGGAFLNCVAVGGWLGSDIGLLAVTREIEALCGSPVRKLGRARDLDADILFLEGGSSSSELILPHPRMHLRRFVLVPLAEVFDGQVPGCSASAAEMLAQTTDESHITPCEGFWFV